MKILNNNRKETFKLSFSFLKKLFLESSEYIKNDKINIANVNMDMLKSMTVIYLICLTIYLFSVCLIQKIALQCILVIIAITLQLLLVIYVNHYSKKTRINSKHIVNLCIIFSFLINALAIPLSSILIPNDVATLFPMILILMAQIYIIKITSITKIIFSYGTIFLVFSYFFKPINIFALDFLYTVIAILIALIGLYTKTFFLVQEYKAKSKLNQLCSCDQMTGLYNKQTFKFLFNSYMKKASKISCCALFILDVDDFKHINDQYGHDFGDDFLKLISESLTNALNKTCSQNIIGRFGGDEFVLMLKDIKNKNIISKYADNILYAIKSDVNTHLKIKASCSIGISHSVGKQSYEALLHSADKALYLAKDSGKDTYRINYIESDS